MILVTGGTGFLGRAVLAELGALGEPLRVLTRRAPAAGTLPPGTEVALGDVTRIDDVGGALRGVRAAVHLAAHVTIWDRDPRRYFDINVGGLKNLVQAASFGAVEKIVYTSTILALGPTDGEATPGGLGDEDRPAANPVPGNLYMASKAEALGWARDQVTQGAPLVILHPGIVYGPGPLTEGGIMTRMLADLMAGKLPGLVGPADRRWCHAFTADVARGHALALERGALGRAYVLGGENRTLGDWVAVAARLAGVAVPRLHIPYAVAGMVGRMETLAARLWGHAPRLSADAVEVFRHEWAFSSARAERELGYRVTPLEEGLAQTVRALGGAGK